MPRGIRAIALICLGLCGLLPVVPARAGAVELRELAWLLRPLWQDTYEGYALADRVLGRPLTSADDAEEFARRLSEPGARDPNLSQDVEDRLGRIQDGLRQEGAESLGELARRELGLAPLRASERVEFIAVSGPAPAGYTASRDAFLEAGQAPDSRDVQLNLAMGYGRFRPALLARLEAAGVRIRPGFDDRSVLLGRAPMGILREISGFDGIDSLEAYPKPAHARLGQPAYAALYFRRGVKLNSN